MANQEQLAILKQGVQAWNDWRKNNQKIQPDLSNTDFRGAELDFIDFSNTNLMNINFSKSKLSYAKFRDASIGKTNFNQAILIKADFSFVNLIDNVDFTEADLTGAMLFGSDLEYAVLKSASLVGANITKANCKSTNFYNADLRNSYLENTIFLRANFENADVNLARVGDTVFSELDLRSVIGIDNVWHASPSTIGANTMRLSKGKVPEAFLRGCGLSDWEIESAKLYNPDLANDEIIKIQYRIYDLRATQAVQISPLFISYSHADTAFVDKLETHLNKKGIRFWRDIHDAKAGRLETQIDRAIRQNPTVLLILSENSIKSDWVEHEVRTARDLEKEVGRDILCPVALDDSWKSSPWPKRVMEQVMEYNILPFSSWKDDAIFEQTFVKLIDGLQLFYKG